MGDVNETDAAVSSETKPEGAAAKGAKGVIGIAAAKLWFIVTSYAIQLALPRLLESTAEFGRYNAALKAVSILNNVLIVATIQSVSKHVSAVVEEGDSGAPKRVRQALKIQLALGAVLAGSLFVAAPSLAEYLHDPELSPLLRIGCAVVLVYSLYGALVGALNGRRLFLKQATLDSLFSALRSVGIIGGAALGLGAIGALGGWALAAVGITLIAFWMTRREYRGEESQEVPPLQEWLLFMAPLWLYQACLNGVLLLDLQVLKKTVAEVAIERGASALEAADTASTLVGYYGATQVFAFVPYQLVLALTFVIFPLVSRATSAGDHDEARNLIRQAFRVAFLALLAFATPIAGAASGVLRIAFPVEYLAGAPALGVLVMGIVAFALFVVCATVLTSAGGPGKAAAIAGIALVVVLGLGRTLLLKAEPDESALVVAASATSAGMLVAFLLSAAAVYLKFKALVPLMTLARGAIAGAVGFGVAMVVPHESRVLALVALAAGFFAYLAVLFVLRELTIADVKKLKR